MSRTRAYTRKMRAKQIKRKKKIVSHWHWFENNKDNILKYLDKDN